MSLNSLVKVAQELLQKCGIGVTRYSTLTRLKRDASEGKDFLFLKALPDEARGRAFELLPESTSQLRQDLFALFETNFRTNGTFVEFGATNGHSLSNTWLLEKKFGWTGILAEPGRNWHEELYANRECQISKKCIWTYSGEQLRFNEAENGEFSTLAKFRKTGRHILNKKRGREYYVETISLADLLDQSNLPRRINYLSLDTEGSEYSILKSFDFSRYYFDVITCEHNFRPERELIHSLLRENGYVRKFESLSRFDDWYVASKDLHSARAADSE